MNLSFILVLFNLVLLSYDIYLTTAKFDFTHLEGKALANTYGVLMLAKLLIALIFIIELIILTCFYVFKKNSRTITVKIALLASVVGIILIFPSCSTSSKQKPENKKLLGFKTMFLSELGDEKYFELEQELENEKMETRYINDIIYISYLDELNTCGRYDGAIEFVGDTINLKVGLISDEVCTSTSIYRITFLIDNPEGTRKLIKK